MGKLSSPFELTLRELRPRRAAQLPRIMKPSRSGSMPAYAQLDTPNVRLARVS